MQPPSAIRKNSWMVASFKHAQFAHGTGVGTLPATPGWLSPYSERHEFFFGR